MDPKVTHAHSISYSAFLLQTLTERWKLVISVAPGIASDLEGELSTYDFTLSAIVGAMRAFGEKNNFTLGAGLAYTWDFGDAFPMPFLYVDWNIGSKLNINGILPTNLAIEAVPQPCLTSRPINIFAVDSLNEPQHIDSGQPKSWLPAVAGQPQLRISFFHLLMWDCWQASGGTAIMGILIYMELTIRR